jgi:hypothetical protein
VKEPRWTSNGRRLWLTGLLAATTVIVAGTAVVLFYPQRSAFEVRYDPMASNVLLFHAENHGALPISAAIDKFVVSTLKFGKIGYDQFDVPLAKNRTMVAGSGTASIAIPAPTGAQSYLCSQLRSIGFFLDYGQLENGKLLERFAPGRAKQIASDLRCSFVISEASPAASAAEYEIHPPCDKIAWINDCVATVLSSSN